MTDRVSTSASARGASFLILVQVASRALTFILNQVVLRHLSPALLGVAVQLDLYYISVLYFARESLRVALQRHGRSGQPVVNMAYLAPVAGVPLALLLGKLYLSTWSSSSTGTVSEKSTTPAPSFLSDALAVYALAAVVELLAEPAFVAAQHLMLYKVRASAEAVAAVAKTLVTVACVVGGARARRQSVGGKLASESVLPFAVGQAAYAVVLAGVYLVRMAPVARREGFSLLPRRITARTVGDEDKDKPKADQPQQQKQEEYMAALFSRPLLSLAAGVTVQSSVKYLLTQGDSLLVASLAPLPEQGAYALAANYGGLLARLLFQPIEDAARNLFAKLCCAAQGGRDDVAAADVTAPAGRAREKAPAPAITAGKVAERVKPLTAASSTTTTTTDPILHARTVLHDTLHAYSLLSLPVLSLAPFAATPLLTLIAGPTWTSSSSATSPGPVLAAHILTLPLLALNGVSEAFVAAAAGPAALAAQTAYMTACSAASAAVAWVAIAYLGWGARGIVAANAAGMAMRIGFNLVFAKRFFAENRPRKTEGKQKQTQQQREWQDDGGFAVLRLLPTPTSVAATAFAPAVLQRVTARGKKMLPLWQRHAPLGDLVAVAAVGVVLVGILIITERRFVMHCYRQMR